MILDAQNQLCDAQEFTSDAYSTNKFDSGVSRNLFAGEPIAIVFVVDVAAVFPNADELYEFQVRSSADAAMGSPTTHLTKAIVYTALGLKTKHILQPPAGETYLRYIALYVNLTGTAPAITITAFIMPMSMVDNWRTYADNITIS